MCAEDSHPVLRNKTNSRWDVGSSVCTVRDKIVIENLRRSNSVFAFKLYLKSSTRILTCALDRERIALKHSILPILAYTKGKRYQQY